jgi:hypothetical protein
MGGICDFTDIFRLDLNQYADLLDIRMPRCALQIKHDQPEGIVDISIEDRLLGHFREGDRVLLLSANMASEFVPSADYIQFSAYIGKVRSSWRNRIAADPFYDFLLNRETGAYLVRMEDIEQKLINFAGRKNGYLVIRNLSQAMQ